MPTIPIMRPKLPSAERLAPYLRKIDSARIYCNYGPLVCAFEDRLAARYGLPGGTITTVANATIGLTLALTALGARPGTLCVMPSWTFVASAHAATMAGLIPYFVDIDSKTWAIDPDKIANVITGAPGWGDGAHAHAATNSFPRTVLPATRAVANSAITLPFFRDLGSGEIRRVVECVLDATGF